MLWRRHVNQTQNQFGLVLEKQSERQENIIFVPAQAQESNFLR